jgi:hypothetical protein
MRTGKCAATGSGRRARPHQRHLPVLRLSPPEHAGCAARVRLSALWAGREGRTDETVTVCDVFISDVATLPVGSMQKNSRDVRRVRCEKLEPTPKNCFDQQMIRASCYPDTHTKVEFPVRSEVVIDRGYDLLLLCVERVKVSDVSHVTVVLESDLEFPRRVIGGFEVG